MAKTPKKIKAPVLSFELLTADYWNAIMDLYQDGTKRLIDEYILHGGGVDSKNPLIQAPQYTDENNIKWAYPEDENNNPDEGLSLNENTGWYQDESGKNVHRYIHTINPNYFIIENPPLYDPDDPSVASDILLGDAKLSDGTSAIDALVELKNEFEDTLNNLQDNTQFTNSIVTQWNASTFKGAYEEKIADVFKTPALFRQMSGETGGDANFVYINFDTRLGDPSTAPAPIITFSTPDSAPITNNTINVNGLTRLKGKIENWQPYFDDAAKTPVTVTTVPTNNDRKEYANVKIPTTIKNDRFYVYSRRPTQTQDYNYPLILTFNYGTSPNTTSINVTFTNTVTKKHKGRSPLRKIRRYHPWKH